MQAEATQTNEPCPRDNNRLALPVIGAMGYLEA